MLRTLRTVCLLLLPLLLLVFEEIRGFRALSVDYYRPSHYLFKFPMQTLVCAEEGAVLPSPPCAILCP